MKTSLKNLITATAALTTLSAVPSYSTPIYSQDFSTAPNTVSVGSNATVGNGNTIPYEDVAFASFLSFDVSGGKMEFGQPGISADTQYAAAIFLDTSGVTAGDYTWSFDILDYVAGGANTVSSYSLYEGNNDGTLSVRLGAANNPTATYPIDEPAGASSFNLIGSTTTFSGNGSVSVDFALTEAGSAGDYLALTWLSGETADQSGVANATFSIDNIQVVPEPSTLALVGAGFGLLLAARRRPPTLG